MTINKAAIQEKAEVALQKKIKRSEVDFSANDKEIKAYAMELKECILQAVRSRIKYFSAQYVVVGDVVRDDDGSATVEIYFDPNGIHRDSLYPAGYPLGVDNIVLLLTKGWDRTKNPVHGNWKGKHVYGKRHRRADTFLLDAIREFNESAPSGVKANIATKYK